MAAQRRSRVKKRALLEGLDNFEPHELLELILYTAIPRKDTNLLAHRLIERFGTIDKIMNTSSEVLQSIPDMTPMAAFFLPMIPKIMATSLKQNHIAEKKIVTSREAAIFFTSLINNSNTEELIVVFQDSRYRVIDILRTSQKGINAVSVNIRQIVQNALARDCSHIMLGHNHPGGDATPSVQDIVTTNSLYHALIGVDIKLDEHIIKSTNATFSFRMAGLINAIETRNQASLPSDFLISLEGVSQEQDPYLSSIL